MFDPGDDFPSIIDGLEPVTVLRPGLTEDATDCRAIRRAAQDRQEGILSARSTAADAAWYLPATELAEPPRPGDVLVDSAQRRWILLDVILSALGNCWRCPGRNLAVFFDLSEYVDIEKAEFSKGSAGADEPTWRLWKVGLAAKIEQPAAEPPPAHDQQIAARCRIYLAEDLPLERAMRIRGPDGTVYSVAGYKKPQTVGGLLEIDVVRLG